MQHVGISVRDLDRSLRFYKDAFGVDPDFVTEGSGEAVSKAVGVPDAELDAIRARFADHA